MTGAYSLLVAYNSHDIYAEIVTRRHAVDRDRVDTRNATEREYATRSGTMVTAPDLTMCVSGCALPLEASWHACTHAHTHTYIMPSINAPLSSIAHLWKITHALDYFNSLFARKCLGNTLSVCVFVHICTLLDLLLDAGNRYRVSFLFVLLF